MGRSKETFGKKEKEKKRKKKREEKERRKAERRAAAAESGGMDDMIAWVDEDGNIVDTPPDPTKKRKIKAADIEIGVPKQEDMEDDGPLRGRLDFFNDDRGFGFIKTQDGRDKFFVHVSNLVDDVREGDKVTFELERGPKGMNAVNVRLA